MILGRINWPIPLQSSAGTQEYLQWLSDLLPVALLISHPELVIFIAGTDCAEGDPEGCSTLAARYDSSVPNTQMHITHMHVAGKISGG